MNFKFGKGYFLISSGALMDPNFHKTVILLCEHREEGSYGLIVNRPVDPPSSLKSSMPFTSTRLFEGGPVQPEILQVLHPYGKGMDNCMEVIPGLWLGGDFEALREGFDIGKYSPDACRFFLGYSGWGEKQLVNEVKTGSWLTIPANLDLLDANEPDRLWGQAVRECGADNPIYKFFPDDPTVN